MKTFNKKKLWCIIGIILVITVGVFISLAVNSGTKSDLVKENPNSDIYPTNANGQTYGLAESTAFEQIPDLLTAKGKNGNIAYMRKEDYLGYNKDDYEVYTVPLTDELAIELAREEYKDKYEDVTMISFYEKCYDIPLFDETGENEIDKFVMSLGYYPYT